MLLAGQPSGFIIECRHPVRRHQFQESSVRHMQKLCAATQRKLVCSDPIQGTFEAYILGYAVWLFLYGGILFGLDHHVGHLWPLSMTAKHFRLPFLAPMSQNPNMFRTFVPDGEGKYGVSFVLVTAMIKAREVTKK
jgi:hypothetical protein